MVTSPGSAKLTLNWGNGQLPKMIVPGFQRSRVEPNAAVQKDDVPLVVERAGGPESDGGVDLFGRTVDP